ncbi:MAG TPA: hypothetical protein VG754_07745 [Verrucomicrobiae bacterium]|jgi:hypothetical protein|nr:hypothetical protein [Verrucomicrobiae bacterium]
MRVEAPDRPKPGHQTVFWPAYFFRLTFGFLILGFLLCGCATSRPLPQNTKTFNFQTDTFGFPNQLVWEYHFDEHGKWVSHPREPAPDYSHRCFVVARSTRQFFEHARFDPSQPVADTETYRQVIRRVLSTSPQHLLSDSNRIVIPGYADLHSFSLAQDKLLKYECGGAWQSYVQHGHWRMLLPFSRHHQEKMAAQLEAAVKANHPPVAHLVRFPQLTINHAIVLFDVKETDTAVLFTAYDPNNPKSPVTLTFDRAKRTFQFPANDYFPGGRVDVYEVYRDWRY